jgi:prepilin-type N-terminal cleavage/methylation domain-containing protein
MKNPTSDETAALTLIEVLVVIAIIGLLAAMILPTFDRVKRQAKGTVCLSNFHHIGVGVQEYLHDQRVYPAGLGGFERAREFVCTSIVTDQDRMNEMINRPLYPYIKPSEVYHCPEDKGEDFSPEGLNYAPSLFYAFGSSYQFNLAPWKYTKHPVKSTLRRKKEGTVLDPARYIMVYESPARPAWKQVGTNLCGRNPIPPEVQYHFHWHLNTGPATIIPAQFPTDRDRYISPILFVDGHAATHDFTKALRDDPTYPTEATKDWIWYEAGPDPIRPRIPPKP